MISEVRSEMGAAENRLTSTVDNLSNASVNTRCRLLQKMRISHQRHLR